MPSELPRTFIHHEPDNTHCPCGRALKRIGEDVSEKLDYTPGVFTVERHIRGKWICDNCETLIQTPVPVPGADNYEPLRAIHWQVHVYGEPKADLMDWCKKYDMSLHAFAWQHVYQEAGLVKDAVYLLRPDTYVALADPKGQSATLSLSFREQGFILPI